METKVIQQVPISPCSVPSQVLSQNQPDACPLCDRTNRMKKPKELYGQKVCKKCCYGFANRRNFAFFLDIIVWSSLAFVIGGTICCTMFVFGLSESEVDNIAEILRWIFVVLFLCKDCFSGYSPGKLVCRVRVIDETTGRPAGMIASFKRNLPLVIPFIPIVISSQLLRGYRMGDGWPKTKVIWKKYANHPIFATGQRQG